MPTASSASTPTCRVLVTGSPGGSRIITTVLQVIANAIDFHMPVDKAVGAPRLHNQWEPDETDVEPGFPADVLESLKARGHTIVPTEPYGSANSIEVVPKSDVAPRSYVGAADPRSRGALAAGY